MAVSDRIAVMNQGRIEQLDPPRHLYERPRTRFVADFVGKINFVDAVVSGGGAGAVDVDVAGACFAVRAEAPVAAGARVTLALRPERLRLLAPGEDAAGWIDLEGTVERCSYLGNVMHTVVAVVGGTRLLVESAPAEHTGGERVRVAFRPGDASLVADAQ